MGYLYMDRGNMTYNIYLYSCFTWLGQFLTKAVCVKHAKINNTEKKTIDCTRGNKNSLGFDIMHDR